MSEEESLQADAPAPQSSEPEGEAQEPAPALPDPTEPSIEERLRVELDETKDRMLRIAAELDNFRKRTQREMADTRKYAADELLRDVLPVLDNLTRALSAARAGIGTDLPPSVKSLVEGVDLTTKQLAGILQRSGVVEIVAKGQPFDPTRHEAVGTVVTADIQEDVIVDEMQKGYLLHDRVLRPAMVRVARAPEPANDDAPAPEAPPAA